MTPGAAPNAKGNEKRPAQTANAYRPTANAASPSGAYTCGFGASRERDAGDAPRVVSQEEPCPSPLPAP